MFCSAWIQQHHPADVPWAVLLWADLGQQLDGRSRLLPSKIPHTSSASLFKNPQNTHTVIKSRRIARLEDSAFLLLLRQLDSSSGLQAPEILVIARRE
jgi:hypothetical protein